MVKLKEGYTVLNKLPAQASSWEVDIATPNFEILVFGRILIFFFYSWLVTYRTVPLPYKLRSDAGPDLSFKN